MMRGSVVVAMVAVMVLMVTGQHSVLAFTPCDRLACPKIYRPVCGTDMKTYGNDCYFAIAKCKDSTLQKLHQGECGQQDCPGDCAPVYAPVCGSDRKTYINLCALMAEKRCVNPRLTFARVGKCPQYENLCPRVCPDVVAPVCGSDGKTYINACKLEAEATCNNKPDLYQVSGGPCENDRTKNW